ncbi:MAG TPA: PBP1A family penicillin-binding protein [Allosphingosinicella sp.]|nr:PBP1A family penicillin-binding protein [Allosphingosinicella sp.]
MSAEQAAQRITLRRPAGGSGRILGFVRRQWKKRWVKLVGIVLSLPFFLYGVLWFTFARNLPSAEALLSYQPVLPTYVRDVNGAPVQAFARERRVQLTYDEFPARLINAFLAAEDRTFFRHGGIDYPGLAGAVFDYVSKAGSGDRAVGGSTITQQVAKIFFTGNEYSVTRKIREAFLARRIESALSKEQILELYLNQIFLGRNAYGVQAAARAYFDKDVAQLTIAECAFLAILPKSPSNYDPLRHHDRALQRRNFVLAEMLRNGFITSAQHDEAVAQPLATVRGGGGSNLNAGGYFMEEVRRTLIARYGEDAARGPNSVYAGGLWVRSSYDPRMQQAAETALRDGLQRYERGRGWRDPGLTIDLSRDWRSQLALAPLGQGYPEWRAAVVLSKEGGSAALGFADGSNGTMSAGAASMPRRGTGGSAFDALRPGAVIAVEREGDGWSLRSIPEISGGMVVEEVATGRIFAMQGGFDVRGGGGFNRATQALRQPGSTFKPIVYSAALDNGMTPASIIIDGPFCANQGTPSQKCFRNFGGSAGAGPQTMRWGLEQSRNLMTVRTANQIGMNNVVRRARLMGVGDYRPYLAISLGAGDTTVTRMVNAFAMFANQGRALTPSLIDYIQDRSGRVIWRADTRPCDGCNAPDWDGRPMPRPPLRTRQIVDPMTAFQIVHILEGVVLRGTATILRDLNRPLFGKTGTTSGPTNVWFIGGSQQIVAGVYMGFDRPRSMGGYAQGGTLAAPIFRQFARTAFEGMPVLPFRAPTGIRMVAIDRRSGRRAFGVWPGTDPRAGVIWEAFKPESEPRRTAETEEIDPNARRETRRTTTSTSDRRESEFLQNQGGIY